MLDLHYYNIITHILHRLLPLHNIECSNVINQLLVAWCLSFENCMVHVWGKLIMKDLPMKPIVHSVHTITHNINLVDAVSSRCHNSHSTFPFRGFQELFLPSHALSYNCGMPTYNSAYYSYRLRLTQQGKWRWHKVISTYLMRKLHSINIICCRNMRIIKPWYLTIWYHIVVVLEICSRTVHTFFFKDIGDFLAL